MTHLRAVLFIAIVAAVVATGSVTGTLESSRAAAEGATRDPEPSVGPIATGNLLGDNRAAAARTISGLAGYAVPSLGRDYLAMRLPRGTHVLIVGPGGSWQAVVNDFGPSSRIRPSRVADIAAGHWRAICHAPLSAGLCRVTVFVGALSRKSAPTAPPTDWVPVQ